MQCGDIPGNSATHARYTEKMPPRYIRATLYDYHFSSWDEHKATGAWWKRQEEGEYLPPISLR